MGAACLVIAGLTFWRGSAYSPLWALAAAAFVGAALLRPGLLYPLNRVWFLIGLALHKVVSPLVMGLLFFLVITPIGLIMRLRGKRPLGLELRSDEASYWIARGEEAQPGAMGKQY
jgi:hypothetical protein